MPPAHRHKLLTRKAHMGELSMHKDDFLKHLRPIRTAEPLATCRPAANQEGRATVAVTCSRRRNENLRMVARVENHNSLTFGTGGYCWCAGIERQGLTMLRSGRGWRPVSCLRCNRQNGIVVWLLLGHGGIAGVPV